MKVDLVLRDCRVHTMGEPARTHALAVLHGRVIALGDEAEQLPARQVLSLGGRTVVPGFHDAHAHTARFGLGLTQLDLSDATSLDEIYRRVAERAAALGEGDWLIGHSYEPNLFGGRHPDRAGLDRVAPAQRVWLKHRSEHMGVANTRVLREAGVFGLDEVPGGVIARDDAGDPAGLLQEQAQTLVNDLLMPVSVTELADAITAAHERYVAEGIVACQEAGVGGGWIGLSPLELAAYQRARRHGGLKVRTTVMPSYEALHAVAGHAEDDLPCSLDLGLTSGLGDAFLRLGAVKIFADGSLASRTAAMSEEFGNDPGNRGVLQLDPGQLRERILLAHRAGWQIATHAIGDRAIGLALDAYREALNRWPRPDTRHRIEHCSVTRPEHVAEIAELGVIPVLQNFFVHALGDAVLDNVGQSRAPWCYRLRSFLDSGIPAAASSDRPVAEGAPLKGMQQMLTRTTAGGKAFSPAEAVGFDDALRGYTVHAAHSTFLDHELGRLIPGMLADFVVLDADPESAPALSEVPVVGTIIEGKAVYDPLELFAETAF